MDAKWPLAALLGALGALGALGCQPELPVCLHERFDELDGDRWRVSAEDDAGPAAVAPGEVAIAGGVLVLSPPPMADKRLFVRGAARYDLAGGFAEIELPRFLAQGAPVQSELVVAQGPANYFYLGVGPEGLVVRSRAAGAEVDLLPRPAFDAAAMRHMRVVLDAAGTVQYQTSPDGAAWTTQRPRPGEPPEPIAFPVDALHVELEVDSYQQGVPAPGGAGFDNLVLAAPGCSADGHELGPHPP